MGVNWQLAFLALRSWMDDGHPRRLMKTRALPSRYRLAADVRSTEELVAAGAYAYAHSCLTSESFPARHHITTAAREIVLLELDEDGTSEEVLAEAAARTLERPHYEDALVFGIAHPDVQREQPIVFLHDPWHGYFGRRDVVCLWCNAGQRELGLEGFDERWRAGHRFAFVTLAR